MALQMPLDAGSDKAAKMQESLADIDLPAPMERDAAERYKDELRSYVQGFYRFCNLYIHREAFVNPFQRNLFIADYSPFDNIMNDEELLQRQVIRPCAQFVRACAGWCAHQWPAAEAWLLLRASGRFCTCPCTLRTGQCAQTPIRLDTSSLGRLQPQCRRLRRGPVMLQRLG